LIKTAFFFFTTDLPGRLKIHLVATKSAFRSGIVISETNYLKLQLHLGHLNNSCFIARTMFSSPTCNSYYDQDWQIFWFQRIFRGLEFSWVDPNSGIEFPIQDPRKPNLNFRQFCLLLQKKFFLLQKKTTGAVCIFFVDCLLLLLLLTIARLWITNSGQTRLSFGKNRVSFWSLWMIWSNLGAHGFSFGSLWIQFWELVEGEEGKSVSEPLPPLGAGCHSASKTSIILSVRIVENFFWVMHASMNSSCVICPSWFSSISWNADSARTS